MQKSFDHSGQGSYPGCRSYHRHGSYFPGYSFHHGHASHYPGYEYRHGTHSQKHHFHHSAYH